MDSPTVRLNRCLSEVASIYKQRLLNRAVPVTRRGRSSSLCKNATLDILTLSGFLMTSKADVKKQPTSKALRDASWEKRWCKLDVDKLLIFKDQADCQNSEKPTMVLSLASVMSICTIDDGGLNLTFTAADVEEKHWWLFNFQRSIAQLISRGFTCGAFCVLSPQLACDSARRHHSWVSKSGERTSKNQVLGKGLVVVSAADPGRKNYMEDIVVAIEDLNSAYKLKDYPEQGFCAVYDGHCGDEAARFCSDTIHEYMLELPEFRDNVQSSFRTVFERVEGEFLEWANDPEIEAMSGTTAIAALVRGHDLFVANLGDCRAVLCRDGKAMDLSSDHRPCRKDEVKRIESMGGWVVREEVLNVPKLYQLGLEEMEELEEAEELVGWVTIERVCGVLQMTRSIGDRLIKGTQKKEFFETEFQGEFILATPEVKHHTICLDDQFMILASDGVWDVFSSQEAVDFISARLRLGVSLQGVAELLMGACIDKGSLDNMSCVIAFFHPAKRLKDYPWKPEVVALSSSPVLPEFTPSSP